MSAKESYIEETYLTIPEMQKYLRISKSMAYALVNDDVIPSYQISERKTLVRKKDIDDYVLSRKRN